VKSNDSLRILSTRGGPSYNLAGVYTIALISGGTTMPRDRRASTRDLDDSTNGLFSPRRTASVDAVQIVPLSSLCEDQESDFFALLSNKQEFKTKDGKPFFKVTFRDALREIVTPIWSDASHADACKTDWSPGQFFKLRAILRRHTQYGLQLEIKKIRLVEDGDRNDGFDPLVFLPASRFDPVEMFAELMNTVESRIADEPLRQLVVDILEQNREQLLQLPAAKKNHHAYLGGYLEHVLNVTRTCCHLADKYAKLYDQLDPPLNKDVIVAGAVLHDIGKLRELAVSAAGADYSPEGHLIGHVLQGRDIVRETAAGRSIDPELLLRLEHVIVSHQRLPEWGAPKPPMTPEALIVHHADDLDAKMQMMVCAIQDDSDGAMTSKHYALNVQVFRGGI
jgi:3'-5' exoribonuclease